MTKSKLKVNMVSESEFTVQGHGVHTMYVETCKALDVVPEVSIFKNASKKKKKKFDIVHVHTVGLFSLFKLRTAKKKVISAHVVPGSFIGSLKFAKFWLPLARIWLRFFYSRADVILAVSKETKRELEELRVSKPIEVLYNFIDTSAYRNTPKLKAAARKKYKISEKDFVVIGSGQVQPRKRIDVFTKMAEALPGVKFIWVGGIPFGALAAENSRMQGVINSPSTNMQFTGIVDLKEMPDFYRLADAFVLPSEQETFGLVVVEAAAASLPVVLRKISDYDDTFSADALLAEKDDDFIAIIKRLKNSKKLQKEYIAKSDNIAKRFNSVAAADELVKIYQKLLKTTS